MKSNSIFNYMVCVCYVCEYVRMHACVRVCLCMHVEVRGQPEETNSTLLSVCVIGVEFMSSGTLASVFTHQSTSPALNLTLFLNQCNIELLRNKCICINLKTQCNTVLKYFQCWM